MEQFIHRHNVENFKKQLETATDEAQRKMLLQLLADEEARVMEPRPKPPLRPAKP